MSVPANLHIADLPAILVKRGVELGVRLTVAAPEGAVDDELRKLLTKHRRLLLQALIRAESFGRDYAEVLTWDDDGFDWATGEQAAPLDDDRDRDPPEAA